MSFTDAQLARLERDVGDILERRDSGRSLDELKAWADDPVGFDRRAGRQPQDYQERIFRSVVENRFTAVRGCHGAGKEFSAGSLALWAAYCRGMLVLVISASKLQVIGQTMREVRAAWKAHGDLPGELFAGSVRVDGEDKIIALTGGAAIDALTGWHSPAGVLVIISEGQGERLEDAAYDAALACATDSLSRVLAMGNPVRPSGRFYEINQKSHWNGIRVSAFDTPNVKAGANIAPGFPACDWPDRVAEEYGRESAYYVSRVLAEFPDEAVDGLVRRSWIDRAFERWKSRELHVKASGYRTRLVADIARSGPDATCVGRIQGPVVLSLETRNEPDLMATSKRLHEEALELAFYRVGVPRPTHQQLRAHAATIVVDDTGVGGGVTDRLRELGSRVSAFNGASRASDAARFANLRAESYFNLREALQRDEIALPPDELLAAELLATEWTTNAAGKTIIIPKDEIRSRLGRSPDRADVCAMGAPPRARLRVQRFEVRI